jgi:cell division protein FtsQ
VHQKQPFYRVMPRSGASYYVGVDKRRIPLSDRYTYRALVVTGHVPQEPAGKDSLQHNKSYEIYELVEAIYNDPFISRLAGEVHVLQNGEYLLIPRVGNHRILLGNSQNLPVKFRNLKAFYQQALPEKGWDYYRTVNLKYKNQIIAKR